MSHLWRDVRFGLRGLLKRPAFAVVALVSLILGIGINTAVFSLLETVFRHPIPVEQPQRVVGLYQTFRSETGEFTDFVGLSYANFLDYRKLSHSFTSLGLFQWGSMRLSRGGEQQRITGSYISANYFDVLELQPALGRFFRPEEVRTPGAEPVAVLSYGCWVRDFGADPGILGKPVSVNGQSITVVGVAPGGFHGSLLQVDVDLWVPVTMFTRLSDNAKLFDKRDASLFFGIGRLAPGVTRKEAAAEMQGLSLRLSRQYMGDDQLMGMRVLPLVDMALNPRLEGRFSKYGWTLGVAALAILLIACLNVASLLVVRGVERAKEIAMREAVGAERGRIVRQLVTENLLLFLLGGLVSLLVGWGTLELLWSFRPPRLAASGLEPTLDPAMILGALALSLVTGLLFGLLPALRASRPDLTSILKADEGVASTASVGGLFKPRSLLVTIQVALALVALVGAGLFLRSLRNAHQLDLGFQPDHLLAVQLSPGELGYTKPQIEGFYHRVLDRVRALPGVEAAAFSENRLLRGGTMQRQVYIDGQTAPAVVGDRSFHRTNAVMPGFFKTVGIPLIEGHDFDDNIREDGPAVAIINETMARVAWPGEDPIGKVIHFDYPSYPPITVIGVVADSSYRDLHEDPQFFIYLPLAQRFVSTMTLHVRTKGDPADMLSTVKNTLHSIDSNLVLSEAHTMSYYIEEALWLDRTATWLLSIFGALALGLATVGVYGVMVYAVTQRQRELSIRLALGARRSGLLNTVLKEAVLVIGSGVVVGLLVSFFVLKPIVGSLLFGVTATDPVTYAGQSVLLVGVALLGSLLPARRAARTDPILLLRNN